VAGSEPLPDDEPPDDELDPPELLDPPVVDVAPATVVVVVAPGSVVDVTMVVVVGATGSVVDVGGAVLVVGGAVVVVVGWVVVVVGATRQGPAEPVNVGQSGAVTTSVCLEAPSRVLEKLPVNGTAASPSMLYVPWP
jgi:hypothetical protein